MVLALAAPWTRSLPSGVTARTPGCLASSPATVAGTVAANPPTIGRSLVTCPPSRRTASSGAEPAPARFCTMTRMGSAAPGRADAALGTAPNPASSTSAARAATSSARPRCSPNEPTITTALP
jgi:hypothetical protein